MPRKDYRDTLIDAGVDVSLLSKDKRVSRDNADVIATTQRYIDNLDNPNYPAKYLSTYAQPLENGDNIAIANVSISLFNMPDIDLNDENAVAQRISDYFQLYLDNNLKPTVAGMAMALNGHKRHWLLSVVNDVPNDSSGHKVKLPQRITALLKKAHTILETQWESYFGAGKINPVAGIFMAKNNYGYQDKVEYNYKVEVEEVETDIDKIKQKYVGSEEKEVIEIEAVEITGDDE